MTREAELIGKLRLIAKDCHWQLLEDAADTIDELRRDAERYRWLRKYFINEDFNEIVWGVNNAHTEDQLDQAIDTAIKESK